MSGSLFVSENEIARWLVLSLLGGSAVGGIAALLLRKQREKALENLRKEYEALMRSNDEEEQLTQEIAAGQLKSGGTFLFPDREDLTGAEKAIANLIADPKITGAALVAVPGVFLLSVLASKKLVDAWLDLVEKPEENEEETKIPETQLEHTKTAQNIWQIAMGPISAAAGIGLLLSALAFAVGYKYFAGKYIPDYKEVARKHRLLSRLGTDIPVEISAEDLEALRKANLEETLPKVAPRNGTLRTQSP